MKIKKIGTNAAKMKSKPKRMASCLVFFILICLIEICFGKIGIFYSDRPPSYIGNTSGNESVMRRRAISQSLLNLKVIVYGENFDKDLFNTSLHFMFSEWKECSHGKQNLPIIDFEQKNWENCDPTKSRLEDNTFYMHVLMRDECDELYPGSIGRGVVNGRESWVHATEYMYDPRLFAHELGHNAGLLHAAKDNDEYGDPSCVMGKVNSNLKQEYTSCFNAAHTSQLSWTEGIIISKSGTYPLYENYSSFYVINEIYFIKKINEFLYIYEKISMINKGYDTMLIAILQPGTDAYHNKHYKFLFKNDNIQVTFLNSEDDTTLSLSILNFLLIGVGSVLCLMYVCYF